MTRYQPKRALEGALPVVLSSLVGRVNELRSIVELLGNGRTRLVTLTGPGGVGKTRLALAAATELAGEVPVWFVSLATVTDAALVLPTIARTLGAAETGTEPVLAQLHSAFEQDRAVLVLDNFEHLIEAGTTVTDLLASVSELRILVTSREPLRVRGERELPLEPLPLPAAQARSLGEAAASAAVTLFAQRAQEARADFALTDENASTIAEICRRLDGLPLAIELAAARTRLLSPAALLSRLDNRLQLLTHGPRDLPLRLQTLRDAIAWSYELLTPEEQALFRRLSVFAGGFTIEAAEYVSREAGGGSRQRAERPPFAPASRLPSPLSVLDGIGSLVDKSLIRRSHEGSEQSAEPRYGMLETIREFALERLVASGEAEEIRNRHTFWYLTLAERSIPELTGPQRGPWIARLEEERANT